MEGSNERVRINAKQTSKGTWYFEATFENEAASVDVDAAANGLLYAVKAAETRFKADGKVLVSDQ